MIYLKIVRKKADSHQEEILLKPGKNPAFILVSPGRNPGEKKTTPGRNPGLQQDGRCIFSEPGYLSYFLKGLYPARFPVHPIL